MKDVGDRFGAGELILPFVLQSAEVMKRSVAHLEHVPRPARGPGQGHGRAGDGVRRRARHRQEPGRHHPLEQRLHGARPGPPGADQRDHGRPSRAGRRDRAVGAARVDVAADAARLHELDHRGVHVPGARRRRGDQPLVRPADHVPGRRAHVRAGRLLLQGRVRGSRGHGPAERRGAARGGDRRAAGRGESPSATRPSRCPPRAGAGASPAGRASAARCRCRSRRSWARGRSRSIDPAADVRAHGRASRCTSSAGAARASAATPGSGCSPRTSSRAGASGCRPRRSSSGWIVPRGRLRVLPGGGRRRGLGRLRRRRRDERGRFGFPRQDRPRPAVHRRLLLREVGRRGRPT